MNDARRLAKRLLLLEAVVAAARHAERRGPQEVAGGDGVRLFLLDADGWGCSYAIVRAEDEYDAQQLWAKVAYSFENPRDREFELVADGPAEVLWVHERSGPSSY